MVNTEGLQIDYLVRNEQPGNRRYRSRRLFKLADNQRDLTELIERIGRDLMDLVAGLAVIDQQQNLYLEIAV